MPDANGMDAHKLMYHPERVGQWREAGDDWEKLKKVYPIYVEVSPTGACNHRCTFCALDFLDYRPDALDPAPFRERFREMADLGVKSVLLAGEGEPLLHKEIARLAQDAAAAGLDLALTTNGTLLTERLVEELLPHLTWLKVSVDACHRRCR